MWEVMLDFNKDIELDRVTLYERQQLTQAELLYSVRACIGVLAPVAYCILYLSIP